MKNLVKIVGVTSALAMAYAAYAQTTSYSVHLTANVTGYCNISHSSAGSDLAAVTGGSGTTPSLNFSAGGTNNFADTTGHGLEVSGGAILQVKSNTTCTYALTSQNGVLWNAAAGAPRTYTATAYDASASSGSPVTLSTYSPGKQVGNSFTASGNFSSINIDFEVPATGAATLPAGEYVDTLSLSISPPH